MAPKTQNARRESGEDETEVPEPVDDAAPIEVVIGENGIMYVTRSLNEKAPFQVVLTGPLAPTKHRIGVMVQRTGAYVGAKLPGVEKATLPAQRLELKAYLEKSLIQHGEVRFGLICDYAGIDMSWARGSRMRSIKAFYPFILRETPIHTTSTSTWALSYLI